MFMDMASFFMQLRLATEVADFWVYDGACYGKLRTQCMVQGNSESPAIAQAFLTFVLGMAESLCSKLLVYINNVYLKDMAGNEAVHIMDVSIMLCCLAAANITVNMQKLLWCATSGMEVLGCAWSADHSWVPFDHCVMTLQGMDFPAMVSSIRRLCGGINSISEHIPWSHVLLAPFYEAMGKCSEDPDDLAPVAYFSCTFGGQQGSKLSVWCEACTAYEAAKHFYPYLDGCTNFQLETDCAVVVSLHMHKTTNDGDVLAHFKLGLAELGVKKHMIVHRPGIDQQMADWLSWAKECQCPSKAPSAAPEMGGLKEAEEMIGGNSIVYTVGALMASTQSTADSADAAKEMVPGAGDNGDWVDSGNGHGILLWTDSDNKDGWVPNDNEDINGSNLQPPSCAEQYCAVQAVLCDLPWPSDFTDCQAEDMEIQSWIVLCHQCEWLEDPLTPKFRMVETKCLCSAILYELVGRHGVHDAVGTWVLALTRQAACQYVKAVHHALAHPDNMHTLKFVAQHIVFRSASRAMTILVGLQADPVFCMGLMTGGPSKGPAGAASGATPMEIEEATCKTLAEQGEQATREAAALDECKQKILLAIREHLEDEYGSKMAAEFEVRRQMPMERMASAVELAFQEARAGIWAFTEEKAREQSTIEELKEKTWAVEACLAVADKGLKGQQCEEERLAHKILQSKQPEYQVEAAKAMMGVKLRWEIADRERAEQQCKELEEAMWRPLPQKHAALKYVDEEAPLWVVTVQGKDAGTSCTKFKKVLDVHLHYHIQRKIALRSANVVQFAMHPMWWGVAVEATQLCRWMTIVDIPPWDLAPEEDLSPVVARARGLELWGMALLVEEPRVQQLSAWVHSKAPSEVVLSMEMEEDPQPVLTLHSWEEGEIMEHPDWTGEQEALPAEKWDREPELQLRLGPVSNDSQQPLPEPRRVIQIKCHCIKEGECPVEMDGTLGDEMVLIDIPDGYYTNSSEEENTPSTKRAVKKAAPKAVAAAPAQAEAAGPPSTKPPGGAELGGPSTSPQ
ncbi:hypothetical protein LPJ61_002278 [Coemansia biformis]|uniref:Reverse transcriptase domain-containing protein n=1 Tax=Coemansia biformis TaxID=1286918 RepID=A0A9W7YDD6_9FUNG|nr:hypothetical protein LPJ61_002278 [Coemansia biformis]